jgi:beta-lactamase regulating signal transducer with metallopeptidase domain
MIPPYLPAPFGFFSQLTPGWAEATHGAGEIEPSGLESSFSAAARLPDDWAPAAAPPADALPGWNLLTAIASLRPSEKTQATLLLLHAAGSATLLILLACQVNRLRRMLAEACTVKKGRTLRLLGQAGRRLGVHRLPRILIAREPIPPLSCGFWRPAIVMGRGFRRRLCDGQLAAVLAHELAHHRRHDLWISALEAATIMVWWFNPLVWVLVRALRSAREDACDDLVLSRRLASPDGYCQALLAAARDMVRPTAQVLSAGMLGGHHPLARRFRRIMDPQLVRSRLRPPALILLIGGACLILPGIESGASLQGTNRPAVPKDAQLMDEFVEPPVGSPLMDARAASIDSLRRELASLEAEIGVLTAEIQELSMAAEAGGSSDWELMDRVERARRLASELIGREAVLRAEVLALP